MKNKTILAYLVANAPVERWEGFVPTGLPEKPFYLKEDMREYIDAMKVYSAAWARAAKEQWPVFWANETLKQMQELESFDE